MTIEFLRARLLSERAASKTAKQQVQQLNEKVCPAKISCFSHQYALMEMM
jgi:hypothetical protein